MFTVIDKQTGEVPDLEKIAYEEEWARGLYYGSIGGFLMCENGSLILADVHGNLRNAPVGRFEVTWHGD